MAAPCQTRDDEKHDRTLGSSDGFSNEARTVRSCDFDSLTLARRS